MGRSVRGIQDAGVQATAKHWLLNEQEILRTPVYANGSVQYEALSSNVDDRTVHELYMWPFANAVREGAASFMCSYQRINGSYACQNSKALNGLLKNELGFQGYVMSDWYAVYSGVASIESGLDLDMPGHIAGRELIKATDSLSSYFGGNITTGAKNGTIEGDRLDDMITRIMTPYYALHQDEEYPLVIAVRHVTFGKDVIRRDN
ncbi:hypothetical protein EsDP_00007480 [Epichloe bromicola]|uniref:beta-glucosidase n=1 Tax=Epichloe bromicola TaxID=79588 RepID=A0ABQ0D0N4_9HYPO